MAFTPKLNHIAGACALLFCINSQTFAQSETQLSPVVVTGETNNLISQEIQAGFGGKWIDQTKSVNTVTREQIDKTMAQKTSEVLKNDSSVQANYSPLGYYESFAIRGFGLDFGTAYQLNGMPLAAEAHIALENKERVEVIKGVSGVETGATSPGGYINFVTKRPTHINSATIGYGERGTFSQAVDFGRWLNQEKTLGIRLNAANETIKPYAREATGDRQFVSAAIDASLSSRTKIETDFDYQKKSQFTQPGWQLLGGTTLPHINPEQVLAIQPWRKPTTTEQANFGTRLTHELESGWKLNAGYQISRIVTSDNSSFPWGCPSGIAQSWVAPFQYPSSSNSFCSDGKFSVSDFSSNGEVRNNQKAKLEIIGTTRLNNLDHRIITGISHFHRRVAQPNYRWKDAQDAETVSPRPVESSYAFGNIFTSPNGSINYPGSNVSFIDNFGYSHSQSSAYIQDTITGIGKFAFTGSLQAIEVREQWKTFNSNAGSYVHGGMGQGLVLPSLAISYPLAATSKNYVSYSEGIELGGRAPLIATNFGQVLGIKKTDQIEVGNKTMLSNNLQSSIAIFQIKKPYEYTTVTGSLFGEFVQRGTQKHTGLELGLSGRATNHLSIQTSAMLIDAVTEGTGDQFDGMKAMNVPKFKLSTFASYRLPGLEQTVLNGGWVYEGSKYAKRDNSVKVPAFNRFDAGVSQTLKMNNTKTTLSLYVENLFDKGYWRDVSEYLGDAYLITGAPRIIKATAKFDF
jgi:iron complex outermembrane receptor protein